MELIIDRLSKQYGSKIAVDRISLRLHSGVYGLLGANGAGKTTLMRMLCGILTPTGGTVTLDGMDVSTEEYRACLGYLPQDFGYYPNFTGEEFLLYLAALKGVEKNTARRQAKELLQMVSLEQAAKKKIKTYSGGMKQRLGIAQALLSRPKLLLCDEPTSALDPEMVGEVQALMKDLAQDGMTMIVVSHDVGFACELADRIIFLEHGRVLEDDTPAELRASANARIKEFLFVRHIS